MSANFVFHAPLAEIRHCLRRAAAAAGLQAWDQEIADEVLSQFARFAQAQLAPLNAPGDAQGCRVQDGRVLMPEGFRAAHAAWVEQGWPGLALDERWGGQGMPRLLQGAVTELFAGANHALQMVCSLAGGAADVIAAHGTASQRATWLPRLASGDWLATMCMSESGAGSDLSRLRCVARRESDGEGWRLEGEKIFISGGDHELGSGILHLVLARTGPLEAGSRGLGLFLCPTVLASGARNTVRTLRIEDKLGLHASPTCQLAFEGAQAELLGVAGEGLKAMFVMMNHARIDVGLQGVAHAAQAGALARTYAAGRVQGSMTIDQHGDVRRMLDEQRSLELTARFLCQFALASMDAGAARELVDWLTPICKVHGSSSGIRAADLGIQVLGGYGYLREYGLEQRWRDARVTAIYEGANGIHAMTLAGRLLRHRDGAAAGAFAAWITKLSDAATGEAAEALRTTLASWSQARDKVAAMADPGRAAQPFMDLTICLARLAAWTLLLEDAGGGEEDLPRLAAAAFRELPGLAIYQAGLIE